MMKQLFFCSLLLLVESSHAKDFVFYVENTTDSQTTVHLNYPHASARVKSITIPRRKMGVMMYSNLKPGNYELVATPSGANITFMIRERDIRKLFNNEAFFRFTPRGFTQETDPEDIDEMQYKLLDDRLIVR